MTERTTRAALRVAAELLRYPDDELLALLPVVRRSLPALPEPVAEPLGRFVAHVAATPPTRLATDYVDTFDLRRRCCLYLTYYSHGDTRARGAALLAFTSTYRRAGVELDAAELPDHLAVVLEFAAVADLDAGLGLLRRHRAGLELLRMALAEAGSPYLDVVDAVRAALPDPAPKDIAAALRLAQDGPPGEQVGLDGFGPELLSGARR